MFSPAAVLHSALSGIVLRALSIGSQRTLRGAWARCVVPLRGAGVRQRGVIATAVPYCAI